MGGVGKHNIRLELVLDLVATYVSLALIEPLCFDFIILKIMHEIW